jgi:hypothetical protein
MTTVFVAVDFHEVWGTGITIDVDDSLRAW